MTSSTGGPSVSPSGSTPATVGGRFALQDMLGRGGSAAVYRGYDEALGRPVAVKLFATGPHVAERTRREMQLLAGLNHPGVVTVYDVGEDDGWFYIVMQLVEHGSLAELLEHGALGEGPTLCLAGVLLATLEHVHGQGIVHRDLKPANILLEQRAEDEGALRPVVADFGVAAAIAATTTTAHGVVTGTAAYLSPEQVRGEPVLGPSDVYSLGLVLLECLTGRREYAGSSLEAAVARLHRAPEVPRTLTRSFADLLTAMTADSPADRPTAAEATARLEQVAAEAGLEPATLAVATTALVIPDPARRSPGAPTVLPAAPPVVPPRAGAVPPADGVPAPGTTATRTRRLGWGARSLLAAVVVLLLAGGAVGGLVLTGRAPWATLAGPPQAAPVPDTPALPSAQPPPAGPPSPSAVPTTVLPDPGSGGSGSTPQPTASSDPGGGAGAGPQPGDGGPISNCATSDLRVTKGGGDSGAGSTNLPLVFTNTGDQRCQMRGFPGVSYVTDQGGSQVGPSAVMTGARGGEVPLAPGASATAQARLVNVLNFPTAACRPTAVHALRIYPPGDTAPTYVPLDTKGCAGDPGNPQLFIRSVGAG
jgi:eukaryotic-like serine/threonine-protein kinase